MTCHATFTLALFTSKINLDIFKGLDNLYQENMVKEKNVKKEVR